MAQTQRNPWADLPRPMQSIMQTRPPSVLEVREMVGPRRPGEGVIAYNRRIGQMHSQLEQRWLQTYQTEQAPGETNWGFGRRQIGRTFGEAIRDFASGDGISAPQFAQDLQRSFTNLWQLPGRAVLDAVEGIRFANDTPAARSQRDQQRNTRTAVRQAPVATAGTASRAFTAAPQAQAQPQRQPAQAFGRLPSDIVQFFLGRGYNEAQARGIAAGITSESAGDHTAFNPAGGGQGAFGLGQWRGERLRRLRERYGNNPTRAQQLEFLDWELRGGDQGGRAVLGGQNAEDVAARYISAFMRPGRHTQSGTARALGYLNPGATTREGLQSMASNFGAPPPAFDPTPFDQAENATLQAGNLLAQPFSSTNFEQPLPEVPVPTPFEAPDFSAGNAAFEAARPQNPFEDPVERQRVQRRYYFRGLAEGLASINWGSGPGLGELFAKMGAGALAGRMRGDDYIDERERLFEEQMRQYNIALANRNDQQAESIARTANANIAQTNQYLNAKHAQLVQQTLADRPVVTREGVWTRTRDPNDPNQVTQTFTPNSALIQAETLLRVAPIRMQRGIAQNQHGIMTWQHEQDAARTALGYVMQNPEASPAQQQQAALMDVAVMIGNVVDSGTWRNMMPSPEAAEQLLQEAYAAAGFRPNQPIQPAPTAEQQQVITNFIKTRLLAVTAGNPETIQRLYNSPEAQAAYLMGLSGDRSVTTRQRQGGQTITTRQGY